MTSAGERMLRSGQLASAARADPQTLRYDALCGIGSLAIPGVSHEDWPPP
jgi:hypothetical protein